MEGRKEVDLIIYLTGKPSSARTMAGAKISDMPNLPDPKRATLSTQPAAVPGTVYWWFGEGVSD